MGGSSLHTVDLHACLHSCKIDLSISSFSKSLLSAYCVPGRLVPGAGNKIEDHFKWRQRTIRKIKLGGVPESVFGLGLKLDV